MAMAGWGVGKRSNTGFVTRDEGRSQSNLCRGISLPGLQVRILHGPSQCDTRNVLRLPRRAFPLHSSMADTPRNARRSAAAAGRTEAAVDLATLTGVAPPGVLCEIMSDGFVPGA
jgi:hypothetical protein